MGILDQIIPAGADVALALRHAQQAIPVPPDTDGVLISFGPFAVRYYAVAILLGIVVAMLMLHKRYTAKGGPEETTLDVGILAVVCGIIGARIYFVLSTPDAYFGPEGDLLGILRIWEGGLAIIGGLIGGAIGIYIGLHRRGLRFGPFVDALAPALLVAQAIGRFGNYFNQELFGTPTDLPWGLAIDAAHMPPGYPPDTLFHPTFLYEQIWNVCAALTLVWLERKLKLRGGQVMAGYFIAYGFGRFWIEIIRTDYAHSFGGLRFNSWAALCVFIVGVIAMLALTNAVKAQPQIADIFLSDAKRTAFETTTPKGTTPDNAQKGNARKEKF
ncbi:MAG: prolipoprotein diacylglyceryl transferase [Actinomycetaceae bacterium]|nr:prolipoprotein diacylglyceryl transferase [Actinomycetaceae bacterium]MDY5854999.1 prolipoprotein diacylglyceryl transferase [Arcanobacterium sp.]